ncbi:MAG: Ig-like domain-containing protein, partial [Pseudomonadota bacterium]
MTSANTPSHVIQKIILLAAGVPGSDQLRDYVMDLYAKNGNWNEVAIELDNYLNKLIPQTPKGINGLIQIIWQNGLGITLSDADTNVLIQDLLARGVDSWSSLFAYVILDIQGDAAKTLDNRATGANQFTDIMESLGKDADYNGDQAQNAAREWVRGIGVEAPSLQAAIDASAKLIARFTDGKVKGTVSDGYVAGATVFIDVDGDGTQDDDEPATTTDADGNFLFSGDLPAGSIIATGGTDISTGLPFIGTLSAPSGAVVITPLTTLAQQMQETNPEKSITEIEDIIFAAFGLPRVDLSSYDPIAAALNTNATHEEQVLAAQIQSATSQIVNILNVANALVGNLAPDAETGDTAQTTLKTLANTLTTAASSGQTVDLSDAQTLTTYLNASTTAAGIITSTSSDEQVANVNKLTQQAGQSLQGINTLTQNAVTVFTEDTAPTQSSLITAMSDVFKLQKLTQTQLSDAITNSTGDLADVVEEFTGDKLLENVDDVQAGSLDSQTPTNDGNLTNEGSTPPNPPVDNDAPDAPGAVLASDTGSSNSDHTTNSGSIAVSGVEAGAIWQYNLDGSAWTDGSGSSFTITGDGAKAVQVRQIDVAGNTSSATTLSFTLDTTAPTSPTRRLATDTGSSASDRITSNGTVNVTNGEGGVSWEYSLDGSTWTQGSGNNVSVSGDGSKTVLVRQTDLAGNTSSSGSLSFTLDTAAPSALTLSLAGDTGNSASDRLTNNGSVAVSGLESGATWQYSQDGSNWTDGSGSSFTLSGDGEKSVQVRQIDVAGNTGSVTSLSFTLDASAPEGLGLSLATNSGNGSDAITNNGTVNVALIEDGAIWQYSTDGSTWTDGSGSSFTVNGDGEKSVQVRQIDVAGNTSSVSSLSFTVDATAPEGLDLSLVTNSGNSSDVITNNGTVNVARIEDGATWQYSLDGSSWTNGSGSAFTVSGDGEKSVQVRQIDVAGNTGSVTSLSFTLDASAPEGLGLSLATNSGNGSDAITNNGTVNVAHIEDGATWQYSTDGSTWTDGSGSSFTLNGDGEKAVQVRQSDVAGNTSSISSLSFTLDTSAPEGLGLSLATNSGNGSDTITNNGTVNVALIEDGATWQYSLDGSTWTNGSGSSFTVSGDGEKAVQVRQIDVAGNTSIDSSISFTVDATAPEGLGLSLATNSGNGSDAITNNGTVNVAHIEDGATWQYSLDGSSWTNGSGSAFTVSGDGEKSVQVRQIDVAGNTSSVSSLSFTIDATAPEGLGLSLATNSGNSSDAITNNGTVNVALIEDGATWQYSLDGSTWSNGSGSSFTVSSDGEKSVQVRQIDVAGNTSSVRSLSFTIDATAPEGLDVSLATNSGNGSDAITNNGTVNVAGIEDGATWQYSLDGSTWTNGSGSSFTVSGDSEKSVQVRQIDVAGNTGSVTSLSFTLDATAPEGLDLSLATNSGNGSDAITNNGTVNVNQIEDGATWQYSLDGSSWTNGSGSAFTVSGDGEKSVQVRQIDVAGNTSSVSSLSFTVDATAPEGLDLSLATNSGNGSDAITNNGTVNVALIEDGATWQYSLDGSTWTNGSGSSFTVSGDGEKAVQVRQIDVAGNTSSVSSISFTVDATAPEGLDLSLAANSGNGSDTITNNGTVNVDHIEDGATWQYSLDGSTWISGSGNSFTLSGDGGKAVQVRQTDTAGNTSSTSSLSFTLDSSVNAPSVALASDTGSSASDGITSNGIVNISGLESGASWQHSLDGSTWTDGSGSSFTISGDGEKSVQVRQIDVAGNTSSAASLSFTVDTAAPAGAVLSLATNSGNGSDSITNNGTVNVSSLESGATWQYSTDGSTWTDGSGSSFQLTGDGSKSVQVRQSDVAGNINSSGALNFTLDTEAPNTLTLSLTSDTGSSATDLLTNSGSVTVSGMESGATWQYSTDGSTWTDGSGSSFSVSGDGEKSVQVRQIDVAGSTSSVSSISFTVDATAPEGLGLSLATNSGNGSDAITNNGTVNVDHIEDGATWQYSLDGSTWIDGSGSSFTLSGDGEKSVEVRQIDVAGNTSSTSSLSFTLDTSASAPSIALTSDTGSSATDGITSNGSVTVSGLESGASWQYSTDGSTWSDGSGSSFSTSGDGDKSVQVRQIDAAGNTSSAASLSFTVDTAAPEGAVLSLATNSGNTSDSITNDGTINVGALESGVTWQHSLDGSNWTDGSGSSFQLTGDGSKSVQVRQIDVAGNINSSGALNFTLDTEAPGALTLSLTSDTGSSATDGITSNGSVTVSGIESGASWQYSLDGSTWTDGSGSSFATTGDGGKTVRVRQIDTAGNTGSSSSLSFTLDASAPEGLDVTLAANSGNGSDAITNDGTINVDHIEDGATWQYSTDGSTWTDGSGSTFTLSGEGEKSVQVRQTDMAGNTSSTTSLSFTLDNSVSVPSAILTSDTGSSATDLLTSNGSVTVSGLESGASWQYSTDGSTWTDGSGSSFSASGDGEKSVRVRQIDVAGNTSSSTSLSFTVDATAPEGIALSLAVNSGNGSDAITNDGTVNINYLEDGATWQYSFNNSDWSEGTSASSFEFTEDGSQSVQVRQIDVAGNVSNSGALNFTLDTQAPTTLTLSLTSDTGNSATDLLTNSGSVTVSGIESGASWQYSLDGSTWTNGSGSSFATSGDGEKNVRVRQIDVAGNTGSSSSLSFTVDASAPEGLDATLAANSGNGSDAITNDGTVNIDHVEDGATWQYSLDGSTWTTGSGSSFVVTEEGEQTVLVRQTDTAGNTSSTASLSFVLDATAPEGLDLALATNSGDTSDAITNDGTVNIDHLEDGASWQYSTDGSTWTDGSGNNFTLSGDGDKTVRVRQTDVAGNTSSTSSLSFTLDTSAAAPSLALTSDTGSSGTDSITSNGSVTVSGLESGASWQYSTDGSTWSDGSGSSFATSGDGEKSVRVRQIDVAGNTSSSASLSFTVDATAPGSVALSLAANSGNTSDGITNDGTVTVASLESGAIWQYSLDGSTWTDGSGSSFEATGDGSKSVQVRQSDAAGNINSSGSLNFTLDTEAPATLTLSLTSDTGSSATDRLTNSGSVTVSGLESGASWQYSTDGSTWTNGSGSSFATSGDGEKNVRVRQIDVAGNTGSASSLSFTVDASAPEGLDVTLASNSGDTSDAITNDGTVNIDHLEDGVTWQYSTNGSTWTDGSGSSFIVTEEGEQTVLVRQTDTAGNTSSTTSLSFTLDATAPEGLDVTLATNSGNGSDTITNNGTINIDHLEDGASWQYSTDGSTWSDGSGGSFVVTEEGEQTVQVRQTDVAGNTSSTASLSFTLDTTAPEGLGLALATNSGNGSDAITNDGTVNVDYIEDDAIWQYSTDGSTWTDGSGSSFNVTGDGSKTVQVRQTDVAGNTSSTASLSFTLDATAPEGLNLLLSSNSGSTSDSITNNGTVNVGYLESGATWQYSTDGSTWTNGSGNNFTLSGDGDKTVRVRQTDTAGNTGSTTSLSFTLDTSAAAPSLALASDTGSSATDGITSNGTVNVSALESGASWQYSLDGSSWSDGSGGSFTTSGDGDKNVLVRQIDTAGNISSATSLSFTVDTAAPEATVLTLATNSGNTSDSVSNDGTVNVANLESGAIWQHSLDGSNWTDGSGSSFQLTGDGSKSVQVRQSDAAGNINSSGALNFTLDTEAPDTLTLSLTSDTGNSATDMLTNSGSVTVSGMESGASWQYSLDGSTWTTGSGSSFATTGDGEKSVRVRQIDVAGNTGSSSSLSFTVDASAPEGLDVTLATNSGDSSDAITNDGTVNIDYLEDSATWQYSTDGSTWTDGSGSSFIVTEEGEQTVLVRQTDTAGNTSSTASLTFTLDASAPEGLDVTLATNSGNGSDTITNNGTINIDHLEDGASWQYSTDGSTWSDGSGSSFAASGDGDKTVRVRQIDTAGNTSSITSLSFTVDATAPEGLDVFLATNSGDTSDAITNNGTINIDHLEDGASWQYSTDGSTWTDGSGSSFTLSGDGDKSVRVRQIDTAGNSSSTTSLSFTLDSSAS